MYLSLHFNLTILCVSVGCNDFLADWGIFSLSLQLSLASLDLELDVWVSHKNALQFVKTLEEEAPPMMPPQESGAGIRCRMVFYGHEQWLYHDVDTCTCHLSCDTL